MGVRGHLNPTHEDSGPRMVRPDHRLAPPQFLPFSGASHQPTLSVHLTAIHIAPAKVASPLT